MVNFENITYKSFGKCIKMTDGKSELIVTVDVGPRVISYSICGGENVFAAFEVDFKKPAQNGWEIYGDKGVWNNFGGHRLWTSPEMRIRTNFPDNSPCEYEIKGETLIVKQYQHVNELMLQMEFSFDEAGDVVVNHTVTNLGMWEKKLAPWSISVMDKGGVMVLPMKLEGPRLLPNRNFAFWTYSNLKDKRFELTEKYVLLRQSVDALKAFKFGTGNCDGVAAYFNKGTAFVKYYEFIEGAEYPDFGCNFESYTDKNILEVESVAPLRVLAQGESSSHKEKWRLREALVTSFDDDALDSLLNNII